MSSMHDLRLESDINTGTSTSRYKMLLRIELLCRALTLAYASSVYTKGVARRWAQVASDKFSQRRLTFNIDDLKFHNLAKY